MNTNLIFILFPIFFMIHEFEEIIMIEKWMEKYCLDLCRRFPGISRHLSKLKGIDTRNFSIIVAEEFLIVSLLTIVSILTNNVVYWYCGLAAFSIHLIIHIFQFIIWKGYIPAIVTTIFCIPYCVIAIYKASCILALSELFIYAMISFVISAVNLVIMHKLVSKSILGNNS